MDIVLKVRLCLLSRLRGIVLEQDILKIYPAIGDMKLPEITPAQITALLLDLQTEGKAHGTVVKVSSCTAFSKWHILVT